MMSPVTKLPTASELAEKDQSIFRLMSSDVDNDDIQYWTKVFGPPPPLT